MDHWNKIHQGRGKVRSALTQVLYGIRIAKQSRCFTEHTKLNQAHLKPALSWTEIKAARNSLWRIYGNTDEFFGDNGELT